MDKKEVNIQLNTIIEEDGESEENKTRMPGQIYHRDHMDVLMFTEEDDEKKVQNLVTVQPELVSIKRSGTVSMHQKFNLHHSTEGLLQHPYGKMHMETKVTHMEYTVANRADNGLLRMEYTVKLNGQSERKHTLSLHWKEGTGT